MPGCAGAAACAKLNGASSVAATAGARLRALVATSARRPARSYPESAGRFRAGRIRRAPSSNEFDLAGFELAADVSADRADRVEVLRQHLVVVHFDAEGGLEKAHQLEHAGGVDDAGIEQRRVMSDGIAVVAKQEVLADELAHGQADVVFHGQGVSGQARR